MYTETHRQNRQKGALAGLAGESSHTHSDFFLANATFEDELRTHPERYEIVRFERWRLISGREVAFSLAIPKTQYDPFALLQWLAERDQAFVAEP